MADHPRGDTARHFAYAAQAFQYRTLAIAIAVLALVEGALMVALLAFLVHGFARILGLILGVAFFVWAILMLFSPLVTRHSLTGQHLILHVGLAFKAIIPCREIASAKRIEMKLPGFPGRVAYDPAQGVLIAHMASSNLILVQLARPRTFKIWPLQRCKTDRVLFNVDEPEAFIQVLGKTLTEVEALPDVEDTSSPIAGRVTSEPHAAAIRTRADQALRAARWCGGSLPDRMAR